MTSEASDVSDASQFSECPVLSSWAKSTVILQRLTKKELIVVAPNGKLNRSAVTANSDLLVPLINLVGD